VRGIAGSGAREAAPRARGNGDLVFRPQVRVGIPAGRKVFAAQGVADCGSKTATLDRWGETSPPRQLR
jgi:hypothetical protein